MIKTIVLFILISLDSDEILNKYIKSLPKDFINLKLIFLYLNFIDNYKNSVKLEYLLIITLKFDLNIDFQFFSPYL